MRIVLQEALVHDLRLRDLRVLADLKQLVAKLSDLVSVNVMPPEAFIEQVQNDFLVLDVFLEALPDLAEELSEDVHPIEAQILRSQRRDDFIAAQEDAPLQPSDPCAQIIDNQVEADPLGFFPQVLEDERFLLQCVFGVGSQGPPDPERRGKAEVLLERIWAVYFFDFPDLGARPAVFLAVAFGGLLRTRTALTLSEVEKKQEDSLPAPLTP